MRNNPFSQNSCIILMFHCNNIILFYEFCQKILGLHCQNAISLIFIFNSRSDARGATYDMTDNINSSKMPSYAPTKIPLTENAASSKMSDIKTTRLFSELYTRSPSGRKILPAESLEQSTWVKKTIKHLIKSLKSSPARLVSGKKNKGTKQKAAKKNPVINTCKTFYLNP